MNGHSCKAQRATSPVPTPNSATRRGRNALSSASRIAKSPSIKNPTRGNPASTRNNFSNNPRSITNIVLMPREAPRRTR